MTLHIRAALLLRLGLAVGGSAAALLGAGCSSSMVDSIPVWAGGEPVGTPERPAEEREYPPVNDRPAPRATKLISVEEVTKIEKELSAARASQDARSEAVKKGREEMLANSPAMPSTDPATQQKTKPQTSPGN